MPKVAFLRKEVMPRIVFVSLGIGVLPTVVLVGWGRKIGKETISFTSAVLIS